MKFFSDFQILKYSAPHKSESNTHTAYEENLSCLQEKDFPRVAHCCAKRNVKVFFAKEFYTVTVIDTIALILVTIGALNWGSIGIFGIDAIGTLFGGQLSLISRLIYTVVALAGIWTISIMFKNKVPSDTRVESRK